MTRKGWLRWEVRLDQVLLTKPAEVVQEASQVLEKHGCSVKKELKSELYYSSTLCQVVFQVLHYANLIVAHAPTAWTVLISPICLRIHSKQPLREDTEFEWQPYWRTRRPFCLLSQAPERISIHVTLLSTMWCFCYVVCHCVWRNAICTRALDVGRVCGVWQAS